MIQDQIRKFVSKDADFPCYNSSSVNKHWAFLYHFLNQKFGILEAKSSISSSTLFIKFFQANTQTFAWSWLSTLLFACNRIFLRSEKKLGSFFLNGGELFDHNHTVAFTPKVWHPLEVHNNTLLYNVWQYCYQRTLILSVVLLHYILKEGVRARVKSTVVKSNTRINQNQVKIKSKWIETEY